MILRSPNRIGVSLTAVITGLAISFGLALAILVGMVADRAWGLRDMTKIGARCRACGVRYASAHDLELHWDWEPSHSPEARRA